MATLQRHRRTKVSRRLLVASVVWLITVSLLITLTPGGAAADIPAAGAPAQDFHAQTGSIWAWPLSPLPELVRAFEAPATRYGAGHRGIDLAADAGQSALAVADGVVTHSGQVAGRGTVTVRHAGGIASTYEPLEERIASGSTVTAGQRLGVIGSGHDCASASCLHLGARLGEEYLDPLLLLIRVRIVLLPLLPVAAADG